MKKTYKILGMHCASCAKVIEMELKDKAADVKASYEKGELEIRDARASEGEIKKIVKGLGYELK